MAVANNYNPYQVKPIPTLVGGLNNKLNADEIQDFELADVENFDVSEASIATSPGFVTWDNNYLSNSGPFWGGFCFKKADGSTDTLTFKRCILATGSSPAMPPMFNLGDDRVMDSTGALELADIPECIGTSGFNAHEDIKAYTIATPRH